MKITFLTAGSPFSGDARIIAGFANALIRRGHQVTVVNHSESLPVHKSAAYCLRRWLLNEQDFFHRFGGRFINFHSSSDLALPESDLLICNGWAMIADAREAPATCGKKILLVQGLPDVQLMENTDLNQLLSPFAKIALSEWLKIWLQAFDQTDPIPVIPPGKDFQVAEPFGEGILRPIAMGMRCDNLPWQRIEEGIAAIRQIQKFIPDARSILTGLEKPGIKLPHNCKFILRPPQSLLRRIYLSTQVWLTTCTEEHFCLPVLDSLSLGCVNIAYRGRAVAEIIEEGRNGFLADTGDVEGLAEKTIAVLEHPALARNIQLAGLESSERFSWTKSGNLLDEYLYQLTAI